MITNNFYATERATAKARATHSLTYDYIEALENVAKAAYEVWSCAPKTPEWSTANNKLYDALAIINFLDETLD